MKRLKEFLLNHPFVASFILVLLFASQCDITPSPRTPKLPIIFANNTSTFPENEG